MSNTAKRALATVLILLGTFLLIMMIDGFYMKTAITAIFVTVATFILRRRKKREEKHRLHERLEKELDEEERLEREKLEEERLKREELEEEKNIDSSPEDLDANLAEDKESKEKEDN